MTNRARPKRRLDIAGTPRPASIAAAAAAATAAVLADRVDPTAVGEVGEALLGWFEEAVAAARAARPPTPEPACRTGCAHCCHLKVTLTPFEAFRLEARLRETLGADELAQLERRVRETDDKTRGKAFAERLALRLPCPLLDDQGACVAYDARPLSCAGTNSYDPEGCRAAVQDGATTTPPNDPVQLGSASAIAEGASYVAFEVGLDGRIVELVAALRILLADRDARSKWARREPVLVRAVDREFAEAMARARPGAPRG